VLALDAIMFDVLDAQFRNIPVAFTTAVLLCLLWVSIHRSGLGEVPRKMLLRRGSTISETSMVTIVILVGASHYNNIRMHNAN
jgi:hypothetical protein